MEIRPAYGPRDGCCIAMEPAGCLSDLPHLRICLILIRTHSESTVSRRRAEDVRSYFDNSGPEK